MQTNTSLTPKPIRLWPGVAAAVVICVVRFILPLAVPDTLLIGMLGALAGVVIILVWWLFFSRAPWVERIGALLLIVLTLYVTKWLVHPSIAGGMMGLLLPVGSAPIVAVALVAAVALSRNHSASVRRASMVVAILLACGLFTLLRTDGIMSGASQFAWRWTPTAEERLLAQQRDEPAIAAPPAVPSSAPVTVPPAPVAVAPTSVPVPTEASTPAVPTPLPADTAPEWPGFRGPHRNGVVTAVHINTDWSAAPPVEMWRRAIGPGWSSFAVHGDVFYTQEQRGDDEIVACYRVSTGAPVWRHRDKARFWESNGGAGPRATPTLSRGRVYAFGATGILNVLDAGSGARVWSRNVASDSDTKVPIWGFSSSPVVVDDLVIVAASSKLAAYDLATGRPRWLGQAHGGSYSSPHLLTIDGVPQIVLLSAAGATSVAVSDGTPLWEHAWGGGTPIIQPSVTENGDILVSAMSATGGLGTRRLTVARAGGAWSVQERWTSTGLKPYFNDFVVHKGHAYGFDGSILASIDLEDGKRKWKGGRYGEGQLVLLPGQDVLLVLSEEGELALVSATPDKFAEIARVPAIDGKTWNHPVVVGDVLLVRNGEEMAAFRLPTVAS